MSADGLDRYAARMKDPKELQRAESEFDPIPFGAEGLPLFTTNPADFTGLDILMLVIPVTRPAAPHERRPGR
ncbi:MAG: hypothetical protein WBH47_08320 [Streptosporangiaceae bacterium]